jgi:hypothetical protein
MMCLSYILAYDILMYDIFVYVYHIFYISYCFFLSCRSSQHLQSCKKLSLEVDAMSVNIRIDEDRFDCLKEERMRVKHKESISRLRSPDVSPPRTSPLPSPLKTVEKAIIREGDNVDNHHNDNINGVDRYGDRDIYDDRKDGDKNQIYNGDNYKDNNYGNRYEPNDDCDENNHNSTENDSQLAAWKAEILCLKATLIGDRERSSTTDKFNYHNRIDSNDDCKNENVHGRAKNQLVVESDRYIYLHIYVYIYTYIQ